MKIASNNPAAAIKNQKVKWKCWQPKLEEMSQIIKIFQANLHSLTILIHGRKEDRLEDGKNHGGEGLQFDGKNISKLEKER